MADRNTEQVIFRAYSSHARRLDLSVRIALMAITGLRPKARIGEVLLPRSETIINRVEETALRAFLGTQRLATLA